MTIERREQYAEVVSPNPADVRPMDVSTSVPAGTTAHQTETFTSDPYAVRREQTIKIQKGIYLLFGILEGLLAIRFVLGSLGANPAAGFAQFIYSVTQPFVAPFIGLFGLRAFRGQRVRCEHIGSDHRLRQSRGARRCR